MISPKAALLVLLFTITVEKSPTKAYNECKSQFDNCSCLVDGGLWLQCPPNDHNLVIRVEHEIITIKCNKKTEFDYGQFPIMNITGPPNVIIKRCPLPENQTLATFLKRFIIGPVRTVASSGNLNPVLTAEPFQGLSDLETLGLFKFNLIEISDHFFSGLKKLTTLNLRDNDLHLTKDIFIGLDQLTFLELGLNNLQHLEPGIFRNQKQMERLNLWGNELRNLTKDTFIGASSVTSIDLSMNKLTTLDYDVFQLLPNLEEINLSKNNFSTLPEKLFLNNQKLKIIRLNRNKRRMGSLPPDFLANQSMLVKVNISASIVSVPGSIFAGSENIELISFADNRLESLPNEIFSNQIHLIDLDLSGNSLTKLHDDVFNSTVSLKTLCLSFNKLEIITRHIFRNLRKLQEIDLSNNNLYSIDLHAFQGTPELRIFMAPNNNLSSLSSGFEENEKSPFEVLTKLEELDLQNNQITHISSNWMHSLPNLKKLNLSYNRVTKLGSQHFQFATNMSVDLMYNAIKMIDFDNGENTDLNISVELGGNPLTCNCSLLPFVQYLNRSNHHSLVKQPQISAKCVEPEELKGRGIMSLNNKQLLCKHHPCPSMCTCWIRYDQTLIVNCSGSNLTKVPPLQDVFKPKTKSIVLHIANNYITKLPDNRSTGYSLVSELYASNNSVSHFTERNIPDNLQVLDLSNNRLKWIDATVVARITETNQTSHLYLGHNPWQCDCSALSLLPFIRANFERIQDLNFMKCTTGAKLSIVSSKDLCKESIVSEVLAYIAAALGVVFALLVGLMYRFRTEIKVWLFEHNMCLHLATEENVDEGKKYDAFISYSHKDEDFVVENLLPNLENGPRPYKLCLHERDWVPGESIPTQIIQSVNDSRRTIIVLSPNFLESVWGSLEFQVAYKAALEEARTRIIIIMYCGIGNSVDVGRELKAYLNTNTYLKWGDPWFWEKLRYAMPHSPYRKKTKKISEKKEFEDSEDIKLQAMKPLDELPPPAAIPLEETHLLSKLEGQYANEFI
ncbi:unnamed protein product [Hermetia illucens]|uniref:TIR domain-containing protein n=1 Tax=Hermetia illucens TaxID=343691 RepID=A0A7R8V1B9_HERIL|nr:protein toll-like [Hermetia illucens]CAD7090420.1 unnamed protein product [Hermetia illucens]